MTSTSKRDFARHFRPGPQLSPSADIWKSPDRFASANRSICPCSKCLSPQNTVSAKNTQPPGSVSKTNEHEEQRLSQRFKILKHRNTLKGLRWSRKQLDLNGSTSALPMNTEWMDQEDRDTDQNSILSEMISIASSNTEGGNQQLHISSWSKVQVIHDASDRATLSTRIDSVEQRPLEGMGLEIDNNNATYPSLSGTDFDTIASPTVHSTL